MTALRATLFNVLFFTLTALIALAGLPILVLSGRATRRIANLWARLMLRLLALIVGLDYQVRGREHLPDGPAILASKHQSAWDTFVFLVLAREPVYVVKRELLWIPLYGWYARRTGTIAVDRAGGPAALKDMVRRTQAALDGGRQVVIFPEGTRSAPGQRLAYHPGVAALYGQLSVPVVPVALNSGLFWGRRSFIKRPGVITVEFLPAIEPGLSRGDFVAELERRIETAATRLKEEAEAACQGASPRGPRVR